MNYLLASRRQRRNCRGLGGAPPRASSEGWWFARVGGDLSVLVNATHGSGLSSVCWFLFSPLGFGKSKKTGPGEGAGVGRRGSAALLAALFPRRIRKAFLAGGLLVCRKRAMGRKQNERKQPQKFHLIMHVINIHWSPYSSHELCWGEASRAAH